MNNAIEIVTLSKKFDDFQLKELSFNLPTGKIMGFVGKNGAGKTTTIRLILNMIPKNSGQIKLFGMDYIENEVIIKQHIGVVLDETFFVETWWLREVEKAIKGFYINWNSQRYYELLNQFEIPLKRRIKDLSRGMKLKFMLAVAMAHDATLLILDEPTSGIDPVAREELLEILKRYVATGEKSVLFSTHITSDLDKIADLITIINNGEIVFTGDKELLYKQIDSMSDEVSNIDDLLVYVNKGGKMYV